VEHQVLQEQQVQVELQVRQVLAEQVVRQEQVGLQVHQERQVQVVLQELAVLMVFQVELFISLTNQ
jgi:hypothetical protein